MEEFQTPKVDRPKKAKLSDACDLQTPLRIPESPFMTRLGYGTGVSVYSLARPAKGGSTVSRSPWAIKKLNRGDVHVLKTYEIRIKNEADILKTIDHPNIVGFRALAETADGRKCLAMEECQVSLGDLIEERDEGGFGPFPFGDILKVALGVASALHYLHKTQKILHGDIKSANILIKGEFQAVKLCDFGVSLALDATGTFLANVDESDEDACYVGTPCWSAPEVLDGGEGPTTNKADIFAFGLVLWEMMALKPPHLYDGDDSDASFDEDAFNKLLGTRPPLPSLPEEYKPIIDVFVACTEQDIDKRPDAASVIKMLQKIEARDR